MTDIEQLEAYRFHKQEWDSWAALEQAFEWEVPEEFNIASYVCDRWGDHRGRVALFAENDDGEQATYTFPQIQAAANRLANYLAGRGVKRGDRIGINSPQKPETAISHIAAWKLGAVSVPLSTLFGPDALRYRLDDSEAVACLVDESNVDTFRDVVDDLNAMDTVLTVGDVDPMAGERRLSEATTDCARQFETATTSAADDAVIIYTSGTTGDPKGVRHAHRFFLGHLPLFLTDFCNLEITERDVFWMPSEWAWIAVFDIVFPALYYGRPALSYNGGKFDPVVAFDLVDRYGVTVGFMPPTALRMMAQIDDPDDRYTLDSLRVIASGGEALDSSTYDWANATFGDVVVHEGYGQTEANMLVGNCTAVRKDKAGKMGFAGVGHDIRILDPETAEPTVPAGEVGEIGVRYEGDPVCFKEYWNKPEKTANKMQNGWLLTEDLGTVDEDGYFTFVSRKDYVIISSGYRIGPEEIEDTLATHDAVVEAGVIGVPDEERGEVPKAYVTLENDRKATHEVREELQAFVKDRLAKYEYPREIAFLNELPKTTTGKVSRSTLEDRFAE
jgi:acetyl-CoA synthetase